jgi:hypothetical protein
LDAKKNDDGKVKKAMQKKYRNFLPTSPFPSLKQYSSLPRKKWFRNKGHTKKQKEA